MGLNVGDQAPLFTLKSTTKSDVSLHDYTGKKVVVLFFPLAFTGTCTKELCSVRDTMKEYEALDAEVLAISVDSLFTLAKFKEEQGYNFPLLSDWNKDVSTAYGSIYEHFVYEMKGVSKRSAFVIDRVGKIRYAEVLENAGDLPNFAAINETLQEIQ